MSSQLYLLHRSILSPRPDGHKGRGPLLLSARPPLWRPLLRSLGQWSLSLSRPLRRRRHYFVDNAPRGLVAKKAFSGNLSVCPRQQSSPLLSSARSLTLLPLSPLPPFTSSAVSAVILRLPVQRRCLRRSVDQRGHLGVHCVRCQIHMDASSRAGGAGGRKRGVDDGDGHGWGRTKDLALIARDRGQARRTDKTEMRRETMMVV